MGIIKKIVDKIKNRPSQSSSQSGPTSSNSNPTPPGSNISQPNQSSNRNPTPPGTQVGSPASSSNSNPTPPGTRIPSRGRNSSSSSNPTPPGTNINQDQLVDTPSAPIGMSNGVAQSTGGSFGISKQGVMVNPSTLVRPNPTTRDFRGRNELDTYDSPIVKLRTREFDESTGLLPQGEFRQPGRGTVVSDRPARIVNTEVSLRSGADAIGGLIFGGAQELTTGAVNTVNPNLNVTLNQGQTRNINRRSTASFFGGGIDQPQEVTPPLQLTPSSIGNAAGGAALTGAFFVPVLGNVLASSATASSVSNYKKNPSLITFTDAAFNVGVGAAFGLRGAARERLVSKNVPESTSTFDAQVAVADESFIGRSKVKVDTPQATARYTSFLDHALTPNKPFTDKVIRAERVDEGSVFFGGEKNTYSSASGSNRRGGSITKFDESSGKVQEIKKDFLLTDINPVERKLVTEFQKRSGGVQTSESSRLFFGESKNQRGVPMNGNPNARRLRTSAYSQDLFINTRSPKIDRSTSFIKVDPLFSTETTQTLRGEAVTKRSVKDRPRASGNVNPITGTVKIEQVDTPSDISGNIIGSRGGTQKTKTDTVQVTSLITQASATEASRIKSQIPKVKDTRQEESFFKVPRIVGGEGRDRSPFYGKGGAASDTEVVRLEVSLGFSNSQPSKPSSSQGVTPSFNLISGVAPRSDTRSNSASRSRSNSNSGSGSSSVLGFVQPESLREEVIPIVIPREGTRQRTPEATKQDTPQRFRFGFGFGLGNGFTGTPPRTPTTRVPRPFLNNDRNKSKGGFETGYFAEAKVGGRFIRLTDKPVSRSDALRISTGFVDTTLSRTGRITPTKAKVKSKRGLFSLDTSRFRTFQQKRGRQSPLTNGFIERSRVSLGSSEVRAIKPLAFRARRR